MTTTDKQQPEKQQQPYPSRFGFGVNFDPTINAGHLMTTVALLVTVVVWGVRLESRVDHEADLRARIEQRITSSEERQSDSIRRIEHSIYRVEDKLDRIIERR